LFRKLFKINFNKYILECLKIKMTSDSVTLEYENPLIIPIEHYNDFFSDFDKHKDWTHKIISDDFIYYCQPYITNSLKKNYEIDKIIFNMTESKKDEAKEILIINRLKSYINYMYKKNQNKKKKYHKKLLLFGIVGLLILIASSLLQYYLDDKDKNTDNSFLFNLLNVIIQPILQPIGWIL